MEQYKTCNGCKQSLPYSQFGRKNGPKAAKSGLRSRCKKCEVLAYKNYTERNPDKVRESRQKWVQKNPDKKAVQDKKYAQKNAEKIAAYQKQYRIANADEISRQNKIWREQNKEKKAQTDKEWAKRNPDKIRLSSKRYRQNNPERAKANAKRWAAKNPEIRRQTLATRRAKLLGADRRKIRLRDIRRLLSRPCAYCGLKSEHLDHVIPISKGGRHAIGNLIGSCKSCNLSKSAMFVSEWKLRRKKLGY